MELQQQPQLRRADSLGICHRCNHSIRVSPWRVNCGISGKNIIEHSTAGDCPKDFFNTAGFGQTQNQNHPLYHSVFNKNRTLWRTLHRRALTLVDAATESAWLTNHFLPSLPCGDCRKGFAAYLESHPPDLASPRAYFLWTVRLHSNVSEKLNKPPMTPAHAARLHGCTALMTAAELALDTTPVRLLIRIDLSLGDSLCVTGAIHDLHNAFPGEYEVFVDTKYPEVFDNLPVQCSTPAAYDLICSIHNGYKWGENFAQFYNRQLSDAINRPIAQGPFRPWLLLSDAEWEAPPIVRGPYWLIFPGGKYDCLTKVFPADSWDRLANVAPVRFVAVGGIGPDHFRPHLNNKVIDMVGQTNVRELIRLIASQNCLGICCGITAGVHLAAAFSKPCVVIAGARERPSPARYEGHAYLESHPPCAGCWALRVRPFAESFHAYS